MQPIRLLSALVLCLAAAAASGAQAGGQPELVSVKKIWDRAPHNAFTDLIRFKDQWFCSFRESDAHVGGDGRIRVIVSSDGDRWESAALLTETGIDLRDPKLSVTPDGRLMIVMGGSVYQGSKILKGRQPRVTFSPDGRQWTAPRRILAEGDWLWRVTWHQGVAYGTSYNNTMPPAVNGQPRPNWTLILYRSSDGINYEPITPFDLTGSPNETTLRVRANGEMVALVRREGSAPNTHDRAGWIGHSRPPFREWTWKATDMRLGGPNFIELPDGSLWAGTRFFPQTPGGVKTALARMDLESLTPALTLPSGGDNSYPGMVWHEGLLWMSYYSSHEGKSGIYLARIKLPLR